MCQEREKKAHVSNMTNIKRQLITLNIITLHFKSNADEDRK